MSDDAQQLTELEMAAWKGFLRAQSYLRKEIEAGLPEAGGGLGIGEYDVLMALSQAPDHASRMTDLAHRVVMTSGGFTRLVDRLVRAGLVARRPCPEDGRGSLAVLTDEGVALIDRLRPVRSAQVRRLFLDHLDEEDLRRMAAAWERILGPEADVPVDACDGPAACSETVEVAARGDASPTTGAAAR